MDNADRSFYQEQAHIDDIITMARTPAASRYKPVGYCLTCYKDLAEQKLFCNNICADGHERMRQLGLLED